MKNIKTYITAFLVVFFASSCGEDYLEILPADQSTVDSYYKNETQIKSVTASLYSRPWFDFNDKFSWAAGDGMAGDLYNDYQDEGQLFFFSYSATNSIVYNAWASLYTVVSFSNAIIQDMPRIASKNGVSSEVINAGLGEARFMRAAAYFFLSEFWGDVPIVEDPTSLIAGNKMEIPRNTQESVYEFITRDLLFAEANLPSTNDPGRVTKWSAKGMLAKVYLTMGQYYKSQEYFDKAKSYAQDVIQNSGLSLMPKYGDLFKIENNNNPESLFALQWANGNWGVGNSRQAVFGRNKYVTDNDECWGGWKSATKSFLDNIQANAGNNVKDPRQHDIIMTLGEHYPEISKKTGGYTYNIVTPDPAGGGDLEGNAPLLNNIKKYIVGSQEDVGVPIKNQGVPLNQYILRLADVYLIYAEAALGLGSTTTDATALQYFNAVRQRMGVLSARTSLDFNTIMNERRVEFGMEGIAWYDVKRRYYRDVQDAINYLQGQNRAVTYVGKTGWQGDRNTYDAYELRQPQTPVTVTADRFNLPIPASELTKNPKFGDEPVDYAFSN